MRPKARAVGKLKCRPRLDLPGILQNRKIGIESDSTKYYDYLNSLELRNLGQKKGATGKYLLAFWLVIGRNTMNGCRDVSVGKLQTIFAGKAYRLVRESALVKGTVKKLPGAIAREHPSGAICAMGAGRQTDDEQPGEWIPKTWNRSAPVILSPVRSALDPANLLAVSDEPRTAAAVHKFLINDAQSDDWFDGG
jgi:hypothetical protein